MKIDEAHWHSLKCDFYFSARAPSPLPSPLCSPQLMCFLLPPSPIPHPHPSVPWQLPAPVPALEFLLSKDEAVGGGPSLPATPSPQMASVCPCLHPRPPSASQRLLVTPVPSGLSSPFLFFGLHSSSVLPPHAQHFCTLPSGLAFTPLEAEAREISSPLTPPLFPEGEAQGTLLSF